MGVAAKGHGKQKRPRRQGLASNVSHPSSLQRCLSNVDAPNYFFFFGAAFFFAGAFLVAFFIDFESPNSKFAILKSQRDSYIDSLQLNVKRKMIYSPLPVSSGF